MTVLTVPQDKIPWSSLGGQVVLWIEENLVYGPGDLRGQPISLDDEKKALIWRMYEVYPKGHQQEGRRRFKRCAISLRKGSAKTEFAALIAAVELHKEGPVRCMGFDEKGNPIGGPVVDPYIPMVAYTEEQSDELAFSALRVILEYSTVATDFDIGLTRIIRIHGDGKAASLASAPDTRDGARTTFQIFDETHRMNSPRLKQAHRTMLANIPKRFLSDAWTLEVTTAPSPGETSVAEDTMDYARQVSDGKLTDSKLFFFHREASDGHDLSTKEGIRAAVIEASGPVAAWSDIDGIVDQWSDPTADPSYLERVWLNRVVRASERAFDSVQWAKLADKDYIVPTRAWITLGFDGSRWNDSTALVGTEISTGFQFLLGLWEKPMTTSGDWEVPANEVEDVVSEAFKKWNVWRMYCDPPYWESTISEWAGKYGSERVIEWWTLRQRQTAYAVKAFSTAILTGQLLHDGNPNFAAHIGNAVRKILKLRDDDGRSLWTIYKERQESPHKIDVAMAAVLSWEARNDAMTAGIGSRISSVYETRGIVFA